MLRRALEQVTPDGLLGNPTWSHPHPHHRRDAEKSGSRPRTLQTRSPYPTRWARRSAISHVVSNFMLGQGPPAQSPALRRAFGLVRLWIAALVNDGMSDCSGCGSTDLAMQRRPIHEGSGERPSGDRLQIPIARGSSIKSVTECDFRGQAVTDGATSQRRGCLRARGVAPPPDIPGNAGPLRDS